MTYNIQHSDIESIGLETQIQANYDARMQRFVGWYARVNAAAAIAGYGAMMLAAPASKHMPEINVEVCQDYGCIAAFICGGVAMASTAGLMLRHYRARRREV